MITLGAKYKDKITGFTGTAVGRVEYLTGCNQVLLVPKVNKDGQKVDGEWFDEQRMEQVGRDILSFKSEHPGFDKEPSRKY